MRAWLFFLSYSFRRQMRARLLVIVSLGLLALVALLVHLNTRFERWSMADWRVSVGPAAKGQVKPERATLEEIWFMAGAPTRLPGSENTVAANAVLGAFHVGMYQAAGPRIFTGAILVGLLASFLMPVWTLTFANEALGRARETRTLTWFLLRPLPRWSMYLAGYLSSLPGALALNLGGYLVFCLLGGSPGMWALPLFWLPILLGALTFTAFFQLLSVWFQRAGILGLLYAFFFETIASNLPGQQKRLSVSYYVRCLIVDESKATGLPLDLAGTKPVVSGDMATLALVGATLAFLVIGMIVFSRKQYVEAASG